MKELQNGNYKTLIKINEVINRWADLLYSWVGGAKIVEMPILSLCNPIEIPMTSFTELGKSSPKSHVEAQKILNSKSKCEPKEQSWMYHKP
jgi:hypothetical protein